VAGETARESVAEVEPDAGGGQEKVRKVGLMMGGKSMSINLK